MGLHNQSAFKRVLMLTAGSTETPAEALLNDYGPNGFAMTFSGSEPSIKIVDNTTPSNNWDSKEGPANSVQNFFKSRSFTSYTGPVTSGKRLMQADGYIKPCRHNLMTMSHRFGSTWWTATRSSVTMYSTTGPSGVHTYADKLICDGTASATHPITRTISNLTTDVYYTLSVYAKAGELSWIALANLNSSKGTYFDLTNGVVGSAFGSSPAGGSTIESVGNGWYRCSITSLTTTTSMNCGIYLSTGDVGATFNGDSTSGVYLSGVQLNNGYLQDYVSSEAHNLLGNSAAIDSYTGVETTVSANADTAPDGTASVADRIVESVNANRHIRYGTLATAIVGVPHTYSVYLKQGTRRYAQVVLADSSNVRYGLVVDLQTGTVGTITSDSSPTQTSYTVTAVANGYYRISTTMAPTATTLYSIIALSDSLTPSYASGSPTYTGDGASYITAWGGQLELSSSPGKYVATTTAAVYNPHFDLPVEYNTDGTVKALTREEARTNIITYSDFSSFWLTQLLTKTNGQTDAGGTSIGALLECTASEVASVFQNFTVSAATAYTVSYYAKMVSGTGYARCLMYNATDGQIDGSDIAINATTWTRVTATFTPTVTSTNFYLSNGSDAAARDFYICFPQIEAGSTASSVIICGSAAVTRAVDSIYMASTIIPYNTSVGTIYQKAYSTSPSTSSSGSAFMEFSDGTTSNRWVLDRYTTGMAARCVSGGSASINATVPNLGTDAAVTNATQPIKMAMAVASNNAAYLANNNGTGTDNTVTVPSGINRLTLSYGSTTEAIISGLVECMYVPTRLADATLQTLTTP